MMFLIASLLLPTSKRSLTRCTEVGGNVLWVLTLVAFSLTHQELSYIFLWGLSISLSSRELLLEFTTLIQREKLEEIRHEIQSQGGPSSQGCLWNFVCVIKVYLYDPGKKSSV